MRLLLLTLGLLAGGQDTAQTTAAPVSQWGWGLRVGVGPATSQHGDTRHEYNEVSAAPAMSLVATRYFAGPMIRLDVEALLTNTDIVVDYQRAATSFPEYHQQTLQQWRLFTPIYIRTSSPAKGLHLLVGAGPTFTLSHPSGNAAYYARPVELTGMVGVEVRVLPWHRYETTLGVRVHAPLTPSYAYGFPDSYNSPAGGARVTYESRRDVFSRWIGFTLSTTFYPAAGR